MKNNPRCFPKAYTVKTTSTPLVGTNLTAAIVGVPPTQTQVVAVADSSMFVAGDRCKLVPNLALSSPSLFQDQVPVIAVPDGTHITIQNFSPMASGDFVVLDWACGMITVQCPKANPPAASIFLGPDQTLTNAPADAFWDLSLTLSYTSPTRPLDSDNLANYWVVGGNTTDSYIAAAWIIV